MGKKQKKKPPHKKKTSQMNSDSKRDNWLLGGSRYSYSESPQIEDEQAKEVSITIFWSSRDTFLCSCNIEYYQSDSETTEFSLMGESEINLIEIEVKVLIDQQDLFEKK